MLFLLGCTPEKQQIITDEKQQAIVKTCPNVFFSKEHRIYVTGHESSLKVENISYRAELNNYFFNTECSIVDNVLTGNLSLLFVILPENLIQDDILLPYYIALVSSEDKIIDIQYYSIQGVMQKDYERSLYLETELTANIEIKMSGKEKKINLNNSLIIGFMLDQEKIKILN